MHIQFKVNKEVAAILAEKAKDKEMSVDLYCREWILTHYNVEKYKKIRDGLWQLIP